MQHTNDPNTTTTPTTGSSGRGVGNKIRGVYEVVHGFGENLRGSLLGALDTMSTHSSTPSRNDQIAQEGRAEVQRGMSRLGRGPRTAAATTTHANQAAYQANQAPPAAPYGETTATGYGYGYGVSGGVTEPNSTSFKRPERTFEQTPTTAQPPIPARHAPGDPSQPAIPSTQTAHPVGTMGGGPGYGWGADAGKGGAL